MPFLIVGALVAFGLWRVLRRGKAIETTSSPTVADSDVDSQLAWADLLPYAEFDDETPAYVPGVGPLAEPSPSEIYERDFSFNETELPDEELSPSELYELQFTTELEEIPADVAAPQPLAHAPRVPAPGYNPFREEFLRATWAADVPEDWADDPSLFQLVRHESSFNLAAKNPTSSAFGLFQFIKSTWEQFLPEVAYATIDPYWQAVGGMRYIKQRYRTPARAWQFWQATVYKDASLAPEDLRATARKWISKNWGGY